MKKRRNILIISAAIVGSIILIIIFKGKKESEISFETAKVVISSLKTTVTATGSLEPLVQVEVGTQVSGVIQKIYVDYNSVVKKGQLLAELDKTPLQAQVAESKAQLDAAKVEYTYQKKNFDRYKELFDKKSVSASEYDNAWYKYKQAESNVSRMESSLSRLKTNLDYATIYSPIDGVVLNRAVDEGQTVAASFNTPTLFTIAKDLTKMQVIANVDEADIGQVKEGQHVTFTVDAYPDDVFNGSVAQVRLAPTTSSNVVTYSVVVSAPNPDLKLKPGLTASITVYTLEKTNILTIPNKAIRFTPDEKIMKEIFKKDVKSSKMPAVASVDLKSPMIGQKLAKGEKMVWIKKGDYIQQQKIKTGMNDGSNIEILDGLKEGDLVVIGTNGINKEKGTTEPEAARSPFMPKRPGSSNSSKSKN
jgi:HlyD family secretion protein